jgi:hypothetical protein
LGVGSAVRVTVVVGSTEVELFSVSVGMAVVLVMVERWRESPSLVVLGGLSPQKPSRALKAVGSRGVSLWLYGANAGREGGLVD